MNVETISLLSTIAFIAAGVLLIASFFMFFAFSVPKLVKELTGIAANQGIKNYDFNARKNESGSIKRKHSKIKMTESGNLKTLEKKPMSMNRETSKLQTMPLNNDSPETTALGQEAGQADTRQRVEVIDPSKGFVVLLNLKAIDTTERIE